MQGTIGAWHRSCLAPFVPGTVRAWHQSCLAPFVPGTNRAWHLELDEKGVPVRRAEVRVTAGGTAKRKRTNAKGVAVLKIRVKKSGTVKIQPSKAGFQLGHRQDLLPCRA